MHMTSYLALLLLAALAPAFAGSATVPTEPGRIAVTPVVPMGAALFPLSSVSLLDGPFKRAQETDRAYLLSLDPDRLLSYVRKNAGLTPKAPP